MGILSILGKSLVKKTSKESSKDVAKKGTDMIGRRPAKDMGMVDEVQPKRLSGPTSQESTKRLSGPATKEDSNKNSGKAIAAALGVAGTGAGIASLASRNKEENKSSDTGSASKGYSFQADRPNRDDGRVNKRNEESSTKSENVKSSSFGTAFKEARAEGKNTFTYEGKKYTTELAEEKKASKPSEKATGVREGRNENIDEDTRKRAMESVSKLAKGGYVNCGASVAPAQKAKK